MAKQIRAGVIGAGMIGKAHLHNYSEMPEVEVVGLADLREDEAQRVAAQHGIPQVVTDYRKLLARDDIDTIDVCLPNNLHCPVTCDALNAGKHVYCEKPMAMTGREARKMLAAAQRNKRLLAIQLGTLFSAGARGAKRLIEEGALGRVFYAKASYYRRRGRCYVDGYATPPFVQKAQAGGGTMADMGVYHMGLVVWLLGNPRPLTVSASTFQEVPMDAKRRKESGYDVEETAMGFVRFAGNITAYFEESWAMHAEGGDGIRVFGSHGGVKLEPLTLYTDVAGIEVDAVVKAGDFEGRRSMIDPNFQGFRSPQHNFVWAVLGRVPLVGSAQVLTTVAEITEAMYKSGESGKEIVFRAK